jgi:hypothetical protein
VQPNFSFLVLGRYIALLIDLLLVDVGDDAQTKRGICSLRYPMEHGKTSNPALKFQLNEAFNPFKTS